MKAKKSKRWQILPLFAWLAILLAPTHSLAWGRQGHSLVAQAAAYIAAGETKNLMAKDRAFDLGYYANVPDLLWKAPKTRTVESPNHYMDVEIFERAFKNSTVKDPYSLSRLEFEKAFPKVADQAGRAYWRILEFYSELEKITEQLKNSKSMSKEEKHALQLKWIVKAGTMSHYIGDLAQPLHLTENHDGQMTNQKGIHSYFEDTLVNELPKLLVAQVFKDSQKKWPDFHKKNKDKSVSQLVLDLGKDSADNLDRLLKLDKKVGRKDAAKAAPKYFDFIAARITTGALYLAELYSRQLGWEPNLEKFYAFDPAPAFVFPPGSK